MTIKKKTDGGKDQFGATHSATTPLIAPEPLGGDTKGNNKPMVLASLDGYFDNITAAATNEKEFLEELVKNLTNLTTRNIYMDDNNNKLTGDNIHLHQQLKILKNMPQEERGTGRRQPAVGHKPATCPNCKQ